MFYVSFSGVNKVLRKLRTIWASFELACWKFFLLILSLFCSSAFAADPFGDIGVTASNLQNKVGSTIDMTLKYVLIAVGVLLCTACTVRIIGICGQKRSDHDETGNAFVSILMLVLAVIFGLILIGIGWGGASATISAGS